MLALKTHTMNTKFLLKSSKLKFESELLEFIADYVDRNDMGDDEGMTVIVDALANVTSLIAD